MFGQNNNEAPQQPPVKPPTIPDENEVAPVLKPPMEKNVYVMPEKFRTGKKTSSNKPLIIVAVILVLVVIVTVTFFLYDSWKRNQQPITPITNLPPVEEIVAPQPEEPPLVPEVTTTLEEIMATETPATTTPEPAVATPTEPVLPSTSLTPPAISRDSDEDSLTDLEEVIMGTLPTNPDTDGDGFKDGNEILNGYNPTTAGNAKITTSPFIATLKADLSGDGIQTIYPKDWQTSVLADAKQAIITTETGEIIRISIRPNSQKFNVITWYLQDHPEVPMSQLKTVEVGTLSGIYTPNGLTAYLTDTDRSKIYVFEYIMNPQTEFRYPTLFAMAIRNFQLIPASSVPAANETATTTE